MQLRLLLGTRRAMRRSSRLGIRALVVALFLLLPGEADAQSREQRAYLRSAAVHFDIAPGEVGFLSESVPSVGEIPVVLLAATRAGVSAEAILAMRRQGLAWGELLPRYGIDAGSLFVPLEAVPREGALGMAYDSYAGRAQETWRVLNLPDDAIVALVNLAFLAEYLDLPPGRVAQVLAASDSPVAAYRDLLRRRMP